MRNRTLSVIASVLLFTTPAIPQANGTKKVKDQIEAELYNSIASEKDPGKKLSLLQKWTTSYPDTDFRQERNLHYVSSYTMLEAKAVTPNAAPDIIREGESAAHMVVDKSDELFAAAMAPGGVKAEDWAIARQEALRQAHSVLATLASNRKDYTQAEAEFSHLLELVPDDAATTYRLGVSIVGQQQPARYPAAIFYLARAVSLFKDPDQAAAQQYLDKVYTAYHGDLAGLDEVKQIAARNHAQPDGWNILTAADVEAKLLQEHPEIALWRGLKEKLTAPDGEACFAANLKDAEIPSLRGRVVSQTGPKEITIAVEGATAEATLKLDAPLQSGIEPGTIIEFSGIPESFAKAPYMLTLQVAAKTIRLQ